MSDPNEFVGGYYRESTYFTYLRVPKAGHFVPNNNFWASYNFLRDYIQGQALACHATSGQTCDVSQVMCDYMNNCSGHGLCESNGKCLCNPGYKGADCSMAYVPLTDGYSGSFQNYGPKYHSFTKTGATASTISFTADWPMDIFIAAGSDSDPTEFFHDIALYGATSATFDS